MTRLRQPQRQVLDTLVVSRVTTSSEALARCVRLVGQHEQDWLAERRIAINPAAEVRSKGQAASPRLSASPVEGRRRQWKARTAAGDRCCLPGPGSEVAHKSMRRSGGSGSAADP